ncbi:MAG: MFS transporter [gamma proteobacterium symbiont of Bathyaustriella thionipta]|nr:MFS transporter [gamma proteobacterium symbiont of Bathyaustriella thionipta]MCU7950278.1 MFS transporter [gamma proteobacterium symbiont of Bathyaustriella thionipta]MCU7952342.1 MFS transporter [gamma proteobacterium symbiont of Bathyaustriella thionipta]MCU7956795.1 MFS transporter [gamma proteobacterium symbiont of Bathyaustriella thionipta]MCU7968310.1 MFS transporter [gamma proteobacterium symbiont of Bathyaustriella thionipta]
MNFSNLLSSKYFAPLFWTQFLGAFNDNLYKNALIIFMTLNAGAYTDISIDLLIPLSGGIFILPFFLFSAIAGQLADKFEKSRLIRIIKVGEIIIMIIAALGFYFENVWFLLTVLFFMGCQSSLFGPVKYSFLPQHLTEEGLLKGNAVIEMGTFLAILIGTIMGGILIADKELGRIYVSALVIGIALLGWLSSLKIPLAQSVNVNLNINFNIFSQTWNILRTAAEHQLIYGAIIAISWFWFIGATMLSILPLPAFTQDILSANERVITLSLALFSIGIGMGSIIAGKSKTLVKSIKWIIIGALGISIFSLDLYWASTQLISHHAQQSSLLLSAWQDMFQSPLTLHVLVDVFVLGAFGGLYIVPLYVILQEHSEIKTRSRTIAANNIVNALFMVISAVATMMLLARGVTVYQLFAILGIINSLMIVYLYYRFSAEVRKVLLLK